MISYVLRSQKDSMINSQNYPPAAEADSLEHMTYLRKHMPAGEASKE